MREVNGNNRNNRKCGPCPVFEVIPWHLPYNGGKSMEKPPLGYVEHCPDPGGSSQIHIYT